MGLVEDHHVVGREHPAPGGQVGAVEVGVDHDDVGGLGLVAGRLGETAAPRGASERPRAFPGPDADHRPRAGRRFEGEIGPVTGFGLVGPPQQPPQLVGQPPGVDHGLGPFVVVRLDEGLLVSAVADLAGPLAAQVVGPSLQHGPREGPLEGPGDQWEVLGGQLVLQRLGRGGDHHRPPRLAGRGEVGERLAGPGPGLDDEVGAGADGPGHRGRHLGLSGALLAAARELGHDPGQQPGGGLGRVGIGPRRSGRTRARPRSALVLGHAADGTSDRPEPGHGERCASSGVTGGSFD